MTSRFELMKKRLLKHFFLTSVLTLLSVLSFSFNAMAVTVQNSGDKAFVIIVVEGATRRDYSVDPQKQITFCLKGCFITLANGDRYSLNGSEVIDISGNRIGFH